MRVARTASPLPLLAGAVPVADRHDRRAEQLQGVPRRSSSPTRRAWELALEEINAAGGVLGRKLEIVSRDDGGTSGRRGARRRGAALAREGRLS